MGEGYGSTHLPSALQTVDVARNHCRLYLRTQASPKWVRQDSLELETLTCVPVTSFPDWNPGAQERQRDLPKATDPKVVK